MSNVPYPVQAKEIMGRHDYHGHELLRHIRKTPTVLYGIFVEVMRQFYGYAENHPMGTPIKVWRQGKDATDIWIDTELRWEDEHPEKRPAIYIRLSPITYTSLTGRQDGLVGGDLANSESFFSRSGKCSVSFVHIAGTTGEACMLGDSTLDYLDAFGIVIRDDFCFTSFALSERIAIRQRAKESKERYESIVTCAVEFQDRWTLKLEAERLKVLAFRAGQSLIDSGIVQ
jgi:hypothetical protein